MKSGKILSTELLPRLAAAYRELAAPGLNAAMKSLETTQTRLLNVWNDFKNTLFKAGVGDFLKGLYQLANHTLILFKPLASFIGGMFKGVLQVISVIGFAVAYILDLAVKFGLLDKKTGEWDNSLGDLMGTLGQVAGVALAFFGIWKFWKIISGINEVISKLFSFKKAATGAAASAKTGFAGFLAVVMRVLGAITKIVAALEIIDFVSNKLSDNEKKNWSDTKKQDVEEKSEGILSKSWDILPGMNAARNFMEGAIARQWDKLNNFYLGVDDYGPKRMAYDPNQPRFQAAGKAQPLPSVVPITLDLTVKGDVVEQHVQKQLSAGMSGGE
jgi:hypothetical protein